MFQNGLMAVWNLVLILLKKKEKRFVMHILNIKIQGVRKGWLNICWEFSAIFSRAWNSEMIDVKDKRNERDFK